jgi:hypothetical protein
MRLVGFIIRTETVLCSETVANIHQTILRHISEDRNFNQSRYIFVALLQANNTIRSVPDSNRPTDRPTDRYTSNYGLLYNEQQWATGTDCWRQDETGQRSEIL